MKQGEDKTLDYGRAESRERVPWGGLAVGMSVMGGGISLLLVDGAEATGSLILLGAVFSALRWVRAARVSWERIVGAVLTGCDLIGIVLLAPCVLKWLEAKFLPGL